MPVNPEATADLARGVARIYGGAERSILSLIARRLGRGLDSPQWAEEKLSAVSRVRRSAEAALSEADGQARRATDDALSTAARRGASEATSELSRLGRDPSGVLDVDELARLAADDVDLPPIFAALRTVTGIYRDVVGEAAGEVLSGATTRRDAAQRALWRWADRGVTGFTDNSGRRWDLASYAEMSVRTATARAAVDAHTGSLVDAGVELVSVSDAPQECELCRPWEGTVLSLTGATPGVIQLDSVTGGPPVRVRVAGSLAEARQAGLLHPNCRHSVSAYLPGATRLPTSTTDREGSQARQQLRYLERQVRQWKRREAAALDEAAARKARLRVRDYQARIREHVAETPAKRQSQREQISSAR